MADQRLTEASVFMWSRERELVPVYDRLLALGATSDCLAAIQELCAIHTDKMTDCTALLAALRIDPPGDYLTLDASGDMSAVLPLIWSRENDALDGGWLRMDPLIEDESARVILIRGSRRHARQLQLLKEIAKKCGITLVIVVPTPRPMPMPTPTPVPTPVPGPVLGITDYVVQPGDTMWLISRRFGVSLDALIKANPQVRNPELIFPGEILHIPTGAITTPGGMAAAPAPGGMMGGRRYVVMSGDTVESVARKFGMNVSELTAFNPDLKSPFTLTPGQVIMIPGSGAVG